MSIYYYPDRTARRLLKIVGSTDEARVRAAAAERLGGLRKGGSDLIQEVTDALEALVDRESEEGVLVRVRAAIAKLKSR